MITNSHFDEELPVERLYDAPVRGPLLNVKYVGETRCERDTLVYWAGDGMSVVQSEKRPSSIFDEYRIDPSEKA